MRWNWAVLGHFTEQKQNLWLQLNRIEMRCLEIQF